MALDYMSLEAGRQKGEEWQQSFGAVLPARRPVVHVAPSPFDDDLGVPAQFAVAAKLAKAKRLLAVRRDLVAAVAELARKVAFWLTDVVIGERQAAGVGGGAAGPESPENRSAKDN